ncbi:DNA repair protein RecN [Halanaerobacter jeridensis]|uniref:DNA repair protein RecN n=1 Tax=Halanaerobacter jeridensis TaxID=706427 RepID=A0A939BQT5_9FIRM|nr:DNA repair protein RecN (Recombination protein N) [Halanaerobacter jeridensis]
MLTDLVIENFALIKEMNLNFREGLNIFTGETGSGKSTVIKALDMLLGARASTDFIRHGEEKAIIGACFDIKDNQEVKDKADELGISLSEDDNLILRREINKSGNNKSRVNGQVVTLELTRKLSRSLIDIQGQHEYQSLLSSQEQLELLDEFKGAEINDLKEDLAVIAKELKAKQKKLDDLNQDQKERERRIDLLKFQLNEIEEAELEVGEYEELMSEKKRLDNAEEISKTVSEAYQRIYESDMHQSGILDDLNQLLKELRNLPVMDEQLKETLDLLEQVSYDLEEVSFQLNDYQNDIEFNEQRLAVIIERLDLINNLKRKYGDTIEEILEYHQDIKLELDELKNSKERKSQIKSEIADLKEEYFKLAEQLTKIRKNVAANIEEKVLKQLDDLSMPEVKFKIKFTETDNFSANGKDKVDFLIATNPGAELKKLAKIASGGELSRVMLALKSITADLGQLSTLVFDEIDAGIGGRVAKLVAEKLVFLTKSHQVLCITHLPQIACMADQHYLIKKEVNDNSAQTTAEALTTDKQTKELARMLAGNINTTTLGHATELIHKAAEKKDAI